MLEKVSRAAGVPPLAALFILSRPEGKRGGWQQHMAMNFPAAEADKQKTPVDLGETTEMYLREAAEDLVRVIQDIRDGDLPKAEDARKAVRMLKDLFQLAMEERTKVEKLRKSVAGAVGASELDFSAARDEIGRRLACLRNAGGD